MSMIFGDPMEVLLGIQRALDARRTSDWLRDSTTSINMGPFPQSTFSRRTMTSSQ